MDQYTKKSIVNACLDEIDISRDKLKSIKDDSEQRILFQGWIRKRKQTLKELGYKTTRRTKNDNKSKS